MGTLNSTQTRKLISRNSGARPREDGLHGKVFLVDGIAIAQVRRGVMLEFPPGAALEREAHAVRLKCARRASERGK